MDAISTNSLSPATTGRLFRSNGRSRSATRRLSPETTTSSGHYSERQFVWRTQWHPDSGGIAWLGAR
jgi:hypothetical protein